MVEYIGVDLGGTNIRVGAIDEKENIIFSYKEPTYENVKTSEDLYQKIKKIIEKVPDYEKVKAIGIGVPGAIDYKSKKVITARHLDILTEIPLVERLEKDFSKKVYIENDARVATLAEAIKGKGKDKKIVCYLTISTGFGGGIVIDKKIYHGHNGLGAYFARLILDGENRADYLISGTALLRQARNEIDESIKDTAELFELKRNGNEEAKEIIEKFKMYLTAALLNISATFNPDIIILGGGVLKSKDEFLEDVINKFKEEVHTLAKNTIIDTTVFDEPGIIGAALLAKI